MHYGLRNLFKKKSSSFVKKIQKGGRDTKTQTNIVSFKHNSPIKYRLYRMLSSYKKLKQPGFLVQVVFRAIHGFQPLGFIQEIW